VHIVTKNGNLLLNIGTGNDGSIPEGQLTRLEGIGKWLKTNFESIYCAREWKVSSAKTALVAG